MASKSQMNILISDEIKKLIQLMLRQKLLPAQKAIIQDFKDNPSEENYNKLLKLYATVARDKKMMGGIQRNLLIPEAKLERLDFKKKLNGKTSPLFEIAKIAHDIKSGRFNSETKKEISEEHVKKIGNGSASKKTAKKSDPKKAMVKPSATTSKSTSGGPAKKAAKKKVSKKRVAKKAAPKKAMRRPMDRIGTDIARAKKSAPKKVLGKSRQMNDPSNTSTFVERKTRSVAPKEELVSCYTTLKVAKEVLLQETVPALIRVARERLKQKIGPGTASGKMKVDTNKKISIRIRAVKNIRIVGSDTKEIAVPVEGFPQEVSFRLKAVQIGECRLAVDLWQEQIIVCRIETTIGCVNKKQADKQKTEKARSIPSLAYPEPINQLRITERESGNQFFYDFELDARSLGIFQRFESKGIKGRREDFVADLYSKIESEWVRVGNNPTMFAEAMRSRGAQLFTQLIPQELQQILYKNSAKIKSIQVISTEPFIPWEMLLVRNPDLKKGLKNSDKFLGEMGVTRWIHGWSTEPKLVIRKERVKHVIPQYINPANTLQFAPDEIAYLESSLSAIAVRPELSVVTKLITKEKNYDLLHFCCHGESNPINVDDSQLMMQDRLSPKGFTNTYLIQSVVAQAGQLFSKGQSRPIVVLNACQTGRLGTGLGGFARAFIDNGAGLFIGALWKIEDETALVFIQTFYESMKKGMMLSEAASEARKAAKKKDGATWIAYAIYGDPFAKLIIH